MQVTGINQQNKQSFGTVYAMFNSADIEKVILQEKQNTSWLAN